MSSGLILPGVTHYSGIILFYFAQELLVHVMLLISDAVRVLSFDLFVAVIGDTLYVDPFSILTPISFQTLQVLSCFL
jgi:hypothetical protein